MSNRWSILALSLQPLTRDGNPGNSCQGAAFLFSLHNGALHHLSLPLSASLSRVVSHDVHHLPARPSTLISAAHLPMLIMFFYLYPKMTNSAGFFFWNLMWLDLVMMERSPTDLCVVTSFHVVFSSSDISSLLTSATCRSWCPHMGQLILIVKKDTVLHVLALFLLTSQLKPFTLGSNTLDVHEHVGAFFQICLLYWHLWRPFHVSPWCQTALCWKNTCNIKVYACNLCACSL